MKSQTTRSFWQYYWALPSEIRQRARQVYKQWRDNPEYPRFFFKRLKKSQPFYSIRIGLTYRAVGLRKADTITWFWIGSHSDYDKLIKQL